MVDLRPLLFINALCFMLLVTAGFAQFKAAQHPVTRSVTQAATTPPAAASQPVRDKAGRADTEDQDLARFRVQEDMSVDDMDEAILFVDQLPDTFNQTRETAASAKASQQVESVAQKAAPQPALKPPAPPPPQVPVMGSLVVRSNVAGDQVRINGKDVGPTPVTRKLRAGTYTIEITKPGYKPWHSTVDVAGGVTRTVVGVLEPSTDVQYVKGVWKNGVKTGRGTYLAKDGTRYEGEFLNGKFHGHGELVLPDGTRYQGEWFEGRKNGYGTLTLPNGDSYTGYFRDDQYNGEGTLTLANGDIYAGNWSNGKLNGEGSLTGRDGTLYVGGFADNQYHGQGSLTLPDGTHYEGTFANGLYHGKGELVYADGKKYVGQFFEGKFHGQGILKNPNGSSIEGTFKFGKPYGMAKLTTPEGEVFTARSTEPGVCYRWKSYRATQCPPLEGW